MMTDWEISSLFIWCKEIRIIFVSISFWAYLYFSCYFQMKMKELCVEIYFYEIITYVKEKLSNKLYHCIKISHA